MCFDGDVILSGYVISLMVLHFLQCGTDPKVMPNLQRDAPRFFDPACPVEKLKKSGVIKRCSKMKLNELRVAELLFQFFEYYAKVVNFRCDIISVRTASLYKRCSEMARVICIEEPFDCTNVADNISYGTVRKMVANSFINTFDKVKNRPNIDSLGLPNKF